MQIQRFSTDDHQTALPQLPAYAVQVKTIQKQLSTISM